MRNAENQTWSIFLWRMKVSEAVRKRDWQRELVFILQGANILTFLPIICQTRNLFFYK